MVAERVLPVLEDRLVELLRAMVPDPGAAQYVLRQSLSGEPGNVLADVPGEATLALQRQDPLEAVAHLLQDLLEPRVDSP